MHEGLTLAIVGRPNVGKSSLFNRLVERERAIVTATPGTTRDLVSETVAIGGIPVKLVDTAGIRRALDEAESIGIRKSQEALADADLVLVVLDASQPLTAEDDELLRQVAGRPAIVVENKCDLPDSRGAAEHNSAAEHERRRECGPPPSPAQASPSCASEILRHVGGDAGAQAETGFLTNLRHQDAGARFAGRRWQPPRPRSTITVPHEMLLLDLYNALRPLDEITGATTTDDILNLIFSTFCIGK